MKLSGTVVAAFGRQYEIRLADRGELLLCYPRGKKSLLAVGDRVSVERTSPGQGVIEATLPRATFLYRSDLWRQKLIAANATLLVLVVATEPGFSTELLSRCLVAAEHENMKAVLVLNKADLDDRLPAAREQLAPFRNLGYPILELAALSGTGLTPLRELLMGEDSVLVGQSGMGKSTLINALVPDAEAQTREISAALDSGKHTTTFSRLYLLPDGGSLIDCPGVQAFGLAHLTRGEIESGFPEFRPHLNRCRFRDCRHDREPDCALRSAIQAGGISQARFAHYQRIASEQMAPG
ncbi:MAG: ribosome small subunit-dependent GTPase A [Rhodocyclaceae bacterium]|nr:ribosome small subunit-dependent GTPase A [Rhodocyclaceae bacterium]